MKFYESGDNSNLATFIYDKCLFGVNEIHDEEAEKEHAAMLNSMDFFSRK